MSKKMDRKALAALAAAAQQSGVVVRSAAEAGVACGSAQQTASTPPTSAPK